MSVLVNPYLLTEAGEETKNIQVINDTTTYDAFGVPIDVGDDVHYYYRSATQHVASGGQQADGRIFRIIYNKSTKQWGLPEFVYQDPGFPTVEMADVYGGRIGNQIYLFTSNNEDTSLPVEIFYLRSTDLTGTSWTRVPLPKILDRASPYGAMVAAPDQPGTYFQGFFEFDIPFGSRHRIGIYKTTDSGATWNVVNVYDGTIRFNECPVGYMGQGRLVMVVRNESTGALFQYESEDYGETWVAGWRTNLGWDINISQPAVWVRDDLINVMYQDRSTGWIMFSRDNDWDTLKIGDNPQYNTPEFWHFNDTGSGFPGLGYCSAFQLPNGNDFVVFSKEIGENDADLYGTEESFIYNDGIPPAPVATAATFVNTNLFIANFELSPGALNYSMDLSTDNFMTFVTAQLNARNQLVVFNDLPIYGTYARVEELLSATTYQYRFRAHNQAGISDYSNVVEVTTN